MKLNPIYKKELITRPRSAKFALVVFLFNIVLSAIGLYSFHTIFKESNIYIGLEYEEMIVIYVIISFLEMGLILFMIPAFTSGTISGERERQTLDILLSTKLKTWDIIIGKLVSSIGTLVLLIFSSMPVLAIVFAIGGFSILNLLQIMCLYVVTTVFIGSIGIYFSTLVRKTTAATVLTYGVIAFIVIGTAVIVYFSNNYFGAGNNIGNVAHGTLLSVILLINPIFTLLASLISQFGTIEMMQYYMSPFGIVHPFLLEHWFLISIVMQIVISAIAIMMASYLLDPLRQRSAKKIRKKRNWH